MKTLTVQLPKEQFSKILTDAHRGDVIVLTDGERRMELEAISPLDAFGSDLDVDSPELEAELLKAVQGSHSPFSENELLSISDRARQEHQARGGK